MIAPLQSPPDSSSPAVVDCLVLGGGLAGLSAATSLQRTLHSVVLFDAGSHRNDAAPHLVTVPSRDSSDPAEFRAATRASLLGDKYGSTRIVDRAVQTVERIGKEGGGGGGGGGADGLQEGWFRAVDEKGETHVGRKVILAMGVDDVFPDIAGYRDCWAKGIFHCLVHRGFEQRGAQRAGILSVDTDAIPFAAQHLAFQARNLADSVTVYTNGDEQLAEQVRGMLSEPQGFVVDARPIARLALAEEPYASRSPAEAAALNHRPVVLHFADGTTAQETFLVHRPRIALRGNAAESLGVELAEAPMGMGMYIKSGAPFPETNVRGVFVAGDAGSPFRIGTQAIVMGAFAAGGVQAQVNMERWQAPPVNRAAPIPAGELTLKAKVVPDSFESQAIRA